MSRILNRVLPALGRIYRLEGTRDSPSEFNIEAGVQLVHDASREAERATGVGEEDGFFLAQLEVPAVGISNYYGDLDLYDLLGAGGFGLPNPEATHRIWILNFSAFVDIGDATDVEKWACAVALGPDFRIPSTTAVPAVFHLGGGWVQPTLSYPIVKDQATDGWDAAPLLTVDGEGGIQTTRLPLFCPPPAILTAGLKTTAALDAPGMVFSAMCWAGIKGTTPPGLA